MTTATATTDGPRSRTRCTGSPTSRSRRSARSSRRSTTRSSTTSASATRTYIRSIIQFHRRLAALSRIVLMASRYKPAWVLGTTGLSAAKIIENMEIGHNVMHGQWDWMNDPYIHSSTWDWDTASPASAWKHSHNYVHHTFTNVVGKDKDVGYEIMRVDPSQKWYPVYLAAAVLQRAADGVLRVGRRRPRPRLRRDQDRQEAEVAGPRRAQVDRPQGAPPDRQGLHRLPGAERPQGLQVDPGWRTSPPTSSATSGRTRSSSAGTSPTRSTCSPRRRAPTTARAPGTCAS